jgi:hypothetical protein
MCPPAVPPLWNKEGAGGEAILGGHMGPPLQQPTPLRRQTVHYASVTSPAWTRTSSSPSDVSRRRRP